MDNTSKKDSMVRKGTRAANRVKHWQLLSLVGVVTTAVAVPLATWFIVGGYYSWTTLGIPTAILIFAGFGFLYVNIGWVLFSVAKLLHSRGAGRYRYFKISAVAVLMTCIITGGFFRGDYELRTNKPLIAMAGADPARAVVIACYTAVPQVNLVLQYNLLGNTTISSALDSGTSRAHRFVLSDLLWNATYVFHLTTNASSTLEVPSDLRNVQAFKTTPRNSSDGLSFLDIADIHSNMPGALASAMASTPADLIIEGGDLTNYGSRNVDWDRYFASTSPLHARTTVTNPAPLLLPVMGNHEALWDSRPRFADIFSGVGTPAITAGQDSPYWYRADVGDIHFIALDVEWGIDDFTQSQEAWLQAALATIPTGDWIIIVEHAMIYTSGVPPGSFPTQVDLAAKLAPLFKQYHVHLVLAGHNHHYERLIEDNITYIIQGTGGGSPDTVSTQVYPGSQKVIWGEGPGGYGAGGMFGKYVIANATLTFTEYYANGTVADTALIAK